MPRWRPPERGQRHILGIGCTRSGEVDRLLILTDIEALMSSADTGLMNDDPN